MYNDKVEKYEKEILNLINEPLQLQLLKLHFCMEAANSLHNLTVHQEEHGCNPNHCMIALENQVDHSSKIEAYLNVIQRMSPQN